LAVAALPRAFLAPLPPLAVAALPRAFLAPLPTALLLGRATRCARKETGRGCPSTVAPAGPRERQLAEARSRPLPGLVEAQLICSF
jgi:hypothetical protein